MASKTRPKTAHIPELDGLRGVAVLLVLFFHFSFVFTLVTGPLKGLRTLFTPGWTGVDLFFTLSGCLITGILLDEKATDGYFKRFYIRRALRIFPVYYLALLVCFTVARPWLLPLEGVSPVALLAYLANFSNWLSVNQTEIPAMNHYWSLAVEEQFYFCWPLAVCFLDRKWLPRLVGGVIVLAPIVRFCILSSAGEAEALRRIAYVLTPARADGLAFGALVAMIVRNSTLCAAIVKRSAGAIAAVVFLLVAWFGLKARFHLESAATLAVLYSVISLAFALIVLRTVSRTGTNGLAQIALRMPVLRGAGKYSYAAYVFHMPLMAATEPIFQNLSPQARQLAALPWFLGSIAVTFALARLSWWLLERPILRWKDVLAPSPQTAVELAPETPAMAVPSTGDVAALLRLAARGGR